MDPGEEKEGEAATDLFQWTSLIHYPLPEGCVVDKRSAKVMTWNATKKAWDDDNITDTDYDAGLCLPFQNDSSGRYRKSEVPYHVLYAHCTCSGTIIEFRFRLQSRIRMENSPFVNGL